MLGEDWGEKALLILIKTKVNRKHLKINQITDFYDYK